MYRILFPSRCICCMCFKNSFGSFCSTCSNSLQTASKVDLRGGRIYIYIYPYGSKYLLKRHLTPQIMPQTLPKKVLGSIGYIYTVHMITSNKFRQGFAQVMCLLWGFLTIIDMGIYFINEGIITFHGWLPAADCFLCVNGRDEDGCSSTLHGNLVWQLQVCWKVRLGD